MICELPINGSERLIFPTKVGDKWRFNSQFNLNLSLTSKTSNNLETELSFTITTECLDYILAHITL